MAGGFWAQQTFPRLLPLLERDASLVRRAELWRAITALFVQGDVTGAVFNMIILAAVGIVAEQILGARRWFAAYLFGLAGAIATRHPGRLLVGVAASAAALALLLQQDVHGIGFWAGAAISWALAAGRPPPAAPAPASTFG